MRLALEQSMRKETRGSISKNIQNFRTVIENRDSGCVIVP
jgi:hypothetical protein